MSGSYVGLSHPLPPPNAWRYMGKAGQLRRSLDLHLFVSVPMLRSGRKMKRVESLAGPRLKLTSGNVLAEVGVSLCAEWSFFVHNHSFLSHTARPPRVFIPRKRDV